MNKKVKSLNNVSVGTVCSVKSYNNVRSAVFRHWQRQVHSVDELKRQLIDIWFGLEQSIFDEAIDQ